MNIATQTSTADQLSGATRNPEWFVSRHSPMQREERITCVVWIEVFNVSDANDARHADSGY
jgi:hypothetical protein